MRSPLCSRAAGLGGFGIGMAAALGAPPRIATHDVATRALLDAMPTAPGRARIRRIDRLICRLRATGWWSALDGLYLLGAHDEPAAKLNWKTPGSYSLSSVGSPAFTPDRGFKGDGASYLTTSINIATLGGQYGLDSAVLGAYVYSANTVASALDVALGTSRLASNASLAGYGARVNDAAALLTSGAPAVGHYAGRRSSSAGREVWKNGALVAGPDTNASTAMATGLTLLSGVAGANASDAGLSFVYFGAAMTNQQMMPLHVALMEYMQRLGDS
jgi:hypothetical protein